MGEKLVFSGYSSDTQVKTNHGWQLIQDVDVDYDKILSLDPKTFLIQYTKPKMVVQRHVKDTLYHFAHSTEDVLVTGNMLMLAHRENHVTGWQFIPANEIRKSYYMPLRGFQYDCQNDDTEQTYTLPAVRHGKEEIIPPKEIPLMDWLEFFGYWLTCGYCTCMSDSGTRKFAVGIKKRDENDEYVTNLFARIGFSIKLYQERGINVYEADSEQLYNCLSLYGEPCDRYIPEEFLELSVPYLERLLLGCEMGKVRIHDDFIVYLSKSKQVIEGIQELLLKVYGLLGQVRYQYISETGKPVLYWYIRACINDSIARYNTLCKRATMTRYDDIAYGVVLEKNVAILVRRNDTVSWCGGIFSRQDPRKRPETM